MKYNQMRTVFHIFLLIIVVGVFSIINFSTDKNKGKQPEIVIVGNDTLGRNWDNLPSAQEIQEANFRNSNSESQQGNNYNSSNRSEFEPIDFSDRIESNKGNHSTVISSDGREIIVE
ncbi:MAG: hypothetical protein IPK18_02170 [Sphingobacteriales bacterium]|jgi:hypothetical protein|nr:MAG: hypothetical protein IPK18_02170 [Sphingobacteriales bacterium]